ncbi:MAG: type II CRISPR RNA-guided endonuclease Cas9 [Clostridium sp.]
MLAELYSDNINPSTGEFLNIITAMQITTNNLMELLSEKFDFIEKIRAFNESKVVEIEETYEILDDLYVSPAVKKSLWQTILISKEIKKIMGKEPKKIFIELTRTNAQKNSGAKDSRKKQLEALYKNIKEDYGELFRKLQNTEELEFRSKKLYLYYTQLGKCMYSGQSITLEELFDKEKYDLDHIYPRSKKKDDSLDNLVLVNYKYNREKSDKPIDIETQNRMMNHWNLLYKKKLISEEKYNRLTRKGDFTDEELSGFIARQLVETSQSAKATAELLAKLNKNSKVVYVKAENVSQFRKDEKFTKLRELNDFHHAKDAYLNIVVGNVYYEKFTNSPRNYIKNTNSSEKNSEKAGRNYSLNKLFEFNLIKGDNIVWERKNDILTVKKQMYSNDVRITKKPEYINKGELFDATLYKASIAKTESYFPIKSSDEKLRDVTKYGGFTKIKIAYYTLISYIDSKGKKQNRVIAIPVYLNDNIQKINEYIENKLNSEKIYDFKIEVSKIYLNTLIETNGFKYFVGGKTANYFYIDSAIPIVLEDKYVKYLKKISNIFNNDNEVYKYKLCRDKLKPEENLEVYEEFIKKMTSSILKKHKRDKTDEFIKHRDTFIKLSSFDQANILIKILNILTDKTVTAIEFNLTNLIKDDKTNKDKIVKENVSAIKFTRSKLSMDLKDDLKIINQSITGLYENEIIIRGEE